MHRHALTLTVSSILLVAALYACGGEEAPDPVNSPPIVGTLELPISRNNAGAAPTDAARVEITPDELRVDGTKVIDLTRGRPAESEISGHMISKLRDRLRTPARSRAALWVNANVPYATLAEVLNTLHAGGQREVHFAVRREPTNPNIGWMKLSRWEVVPAGEDVVQFTGGRPLPWSAFHEHWRDIYQACRAGQYIDCDGTAMNIAQGGNLQTILWTRGSGMKVTFMQISAPDAGVPAPGPEMIEGVRAPPPGQEEVDMGPPATEASFNFRQQEAVDPESAISATVQPVCGTQACQLVMQADATSASMRVITLIGAVYPNGFEEPQIAFRLAEGQ